MHWPVNTMRVNQLLDQDKTVDDDTIQQLWRGWLWNSTPNTDTRLAGGGWNANHAVGALLARALYVCECNSEERDAPNDVGGSTGEPAPEARGEGANDSEGSTGPSAPEARGEDAPGEAAMPEEGAAEADLADELDTLWTAFPLITELHVSPSEFHYMTLREIRDATEVSVARARPRASWTAVHEPPSADCSAAYAGAAAVLARQDPELGGESRGRRALAHSHHDADRVPAVGRCAPRGDGRRGGARSDAGGRQRDGARPPQAPTSVLRP